MALKPDFQPQFRLNDRVVLQSVNGEVIHGTVRWIGPFRFSHESPIPIVGVETDTKVSPERDFPELSVSVTGSHGQELFQIDPNHGRVFLPEQLVIHKEEFQQNEKYKQDELALAKEYGLSVTEYRSQKEYLDAANTFRDVINDTKENNHIKKEKRVRFEEKKEEISSLEESLIVVETGKVSDEKFKEQQEILDKLQKDRKKNTKEEIPHRDSEFTIGSMVSIGRQRGPPLYGIVRWIGTLPDFPGIIAGVELEDVLSGCEDGTWQGHRFFYCLPKRGFFCPLKSLEQDTRAQVSTDMRQDTANPLADKTPSIEEEDMIPGHPGMYIGEGYGIQGHNNSSYLDSTVFGLFALSDSFDEILLGEPQEEFGKRVKYFLWKGIVNPLRKYGLARYESVMDLQNSLKNFSQNIQLRKEGIKDPEEFLNLLFKHILHIEPFLSIKRPFGVEKEYFIQLFFELDPGRSEIPKTEKLIAQMFREQNISFTHVPSKLVLQMPRFGKDFKMYNRIIPSLTLDVKPLLDPSICGGSTRYENEPMCYICLSSSATHCCYACPNEVFNSRETCTYFCHTCSKRIHTCRKHHQAEEIPSRRVNFVSPISRMTLLSVICIETSHFVCYTRSGDQWLFHDSMANRLYDKYNIPEVVDVSRELNEWIYSGEHIDKLMNAPSREIPEYVRRFTQDIYMCVYINPDLDLYGSGPPVAFDPTKTSSISPPSLDPTRNERYYDIPYQYPEQRNYNSTYYYDRYDYRNYQPKSDRDRWTKHTDL